jgi:hypothetical protein
MNDHEPDDQEREWSDLALPGDTREAQLKDLRAMIASDSAPSRRRIATFVSVAAVAAIAGVGLAWWVVDIQAPSSITVHCSIQSHDATFGVDAASSIGSATAFDLCGVKDNQEFNLDSPIACVDEDGAVWVWRDSSHTVCPTDMRRLD